MQLREQSTVKGRDIDSVSYDEAADITPEMIAMATGDPYVWREPFRELTLGEFRAQEHAKEAETLRLKREFEDVLNTNPLGSLLQTGDGKWWRIVEVPDYSTLTGVKRAIEPAKTNRKGRRQEARVNVKRRFR